MKHNKDSMGDFSARRRIVLVCFVLFAGVLVARAVQLQILQHQFLAGQGQARQVRTVDIPAHRGSLLDRHGKPLAVSTPIASIWGEPQAMIESREKLTELASVLSIDAITLIDKVDKAASQGREFLYIKRQVKPDLSEKVMALDVPGVSTMREYRRFYPSGKVTAHVVGFTDIDDKGREGMELAYNAWLVGTPGERRVLRDLRGREVEGLDVIAPAVPGNDLELSIDRQIQYFADRALRDAVRDNHADSASVVVMDIATGEVLAMSNAPTYNPNNNSDRTGGQQRNRAITDVFEPGSTMKPFTIAAALMSGKFKPEDIVYTSPGHYRIGKYEVRDSGNYGWLDLAGIIKKSSNVGVSKIATQLDPLQMWTLFDELGFGHPPGSAFPGEVAGYLNHPTVWHHVEQATLSYGYGISVSALQLARAYASIANEGLMPQVSFVKLKEPGEAIPVMPPEVAKELRRMLEGAVSDEGTGRYARVAGYRVAGKTGTSHRAQEGGYAEDRYVSVFAGFAPVSEPRLACVVVIHDPKGGQHYGGAVAAPVFSEIMANALRLMNIEPDNLSDKIMKVALDQSGGDRS